MQPFGALDWLVFGKCKSDTPRIGHTGDLTIIQDGDLVKILDKELGQSIRCEGLSDTKVDQIFRAIRNNQLSLSDILVIDNRFKLVSP